MTSAPAAYRGLVPSNQYMMANCVDPVLGQGVRISASNTVIGIKHWSGYLYCLAGAGYWYVGISPDVLSNGIAQMAKNFQYYRFTRLVFKYAPSCPTTTSRTLRFAYVPDGGFAAIETQPTFAAAADFEFNWSTSSWSPSTYTIARVPRGVPAYFNRTGDAAAGLRETQQGILIGLIDADPGANLDVGSLVLDFTIEMFAKTTNLNFTISRKEHELFEQWKRGIGVDPNGAAAASAASCVGPTYPMTTPDSTGACPQVCGPTAMVAQPSPDTRMPFQGMPCPAQPAATQQRRI
jgi:hypothetical protein